MNKCLGTTYPFFQDLIKKIESDELKLDKQWLYYHDAKAWFCKVQYKKKTIFWLTIWDNYFKLGFYFTEKSDKDIKDIEIAEEVKEQYFEMKRMGKIKPVIINVKKQESIDDALLLIAYKKSLL